MEFADFVNNFKNALEECLEKFREKYEYRLEYDYNYTVKDDFAMFKIVLWYDCELWKEPYEMYIDFTLENRKKSIAIGAEARGRVIVFAIDKTVKKVDWLKVIIMEVMEKLLEKDFEELDKRLEFCYRIKDLIDEYPLYRAWDAMYIKIGRSEVAIHPEDINGNMYPGKIYIEFERKEESVIFADFVENSISIDKTKIEIEVDPLGIVSINLESFKPEERFNILKKVIKALEMLYLF